MFFFALTLAIGAEAQNKLNTQIARYLHSRQNALQQSQRAAGQQEEMVPCLLRITAPYTEQLEAMTNIKFYSDAISEQNVSTSESSLKKWHFSS